ncbi:hypothetical protein C2G38_2038567 [Gigaspora rosea]|uniref:Uncharacterized protein n=1 Tax=Gigaspora rosea TaxID=44941 RepID=A0A397V1S5_9GLOM|nr:hypothetical protein C2G38_2038567 [Gigaspora rosea]
MASNSNNTNNYNDDKNKVEPNSNIALLLRLLSNPANLQQMLASMTQTTSASSAIVGVVNISEEWIQWKKTKKLEEDWKDFLHLPHATYWTYRFKREFPTFPISVGDFVLQKISENILGNWVETERKKKVKEAYDKGILPPPKRVLPSTNITSPTTNSIEIDSDEAEENIDALSKLLETEDDARKKKMAKANSKRAAKKQIIKEIGSDENESGDNIDAEFFSSELPETDVDAITELFVPTTQTKRAIEKLSDIRKKKTAKANSKRAAKKQTIKEIESDSCEIEDNIDAEFLSSELLEVDVDARKKKTAKANSKRAAKKQTIKEIESDSGEIEDNIDAEFLSSKLPEVNDDASTELSVPTTQTKRAIEKLSDISNQPSTQARQSGNNSGKKKTAKANSKRATKKQTMKKIESDSGEIEDNIDAELLSSKLPEVDDDASTKLSVPITRSKKTTDSNQPLIQAQQSGNNSGIALYLLF